MPADAEQIVSGGVIATLSTLAAGLLALLHRAFGKTIPGLAERFERRLEAQQKAHDERLDKVLAAQSEERRQWRADMLSHFDRERAQRERDRVEDQSLTREMTSALGRLEDEVRRSKGGT